MTEHVGFTLHWIYCMNLIVPCLFALQKQSPIALGWKGNMKMEEKREKEKGKRNGWYSRNRLETEQGFGSCYKKEGKRKIWQTLFIRNAQRPVCTKSRVIKRVVTPG